MPWFKVDDNLAFHAKSVAAGNAAMGLWVRAGSWCAQQLTDGHVPNHMVVALGNTAQAKRLVDVGLWTRDGNGYRFWQWGDRNPRRDQVEEERAAARERMRAAREAKRSSRTPAEVQANTARTSGPVRVTPTRPDPTRPVVVSGESEEVDVTDVRATLEAAVASWGQDLPDEWASGQ